VINNDNVTNAFSITGYETANVTPAFIKIVIRLNDYVNIAYAVCAIGSIRATEVVQSKTKIRCDCSV